MFPAFIRGNHWVLAIIDVIGRHLIYYDPYHAVDDQNVMQCALRWVTGEVRTATRGDIFKGLTPSQWPIFYNPSYLPVQTDTDSCGVFVLFVAEHLKRGVYPSFKQTDIPVLRLRTLWSLKKQILHDYGE